ncbi:TPA: hypothetical protein ACSP2D_002975 [Aeromonas veronii]
MKEQYAIFDSDKHGFDYQDNFIVVRERRVFLRIFGQQPTWEIITATADENHGGPKVCQAQQQLITAATSLAEELVGSARIEHDRYGRKFVSICVVEQESEQDDDSFGQELSGYLNRFFELFDGLNTGGATTS